MSPPISLDNATFGTVWTVFITLKYTAPRSKASVQQAQYERNLRMDVHAFWRTNASRDVFVKPVIFVVVC